MNIKALRNKAILAVNNAAVAVKPHAVAGLEWVGKHPKTVTFAVTAVMFLSNQGNQKRAAAYATTPRRAFVKDMIGHVGLATSVYDFAMIISREMERQAKSDKDDAEIAGIATHADELLARARAMDSDFKANQTAADK